MKRNIIVVCFVYLLIGALLVVGCAAPTPPTTRVVKIGALLSLTGPDAHTGPYIDRGIKWKLDEINWEVAGCKIELVEEDDASDPSVAMDMVRKLVEQDKVAVVLGPMSSASAIGVANYLGTAKIPNISFLQNTMDVIQQGDGFACLPQGTLKGSSYAVGQYAYEKLGYRTVSALRIDHIATVHFVGGLVEGFVSKGGTQVQDQTTPLKVLDFAPYFAALETADFFTVWMMPTDMLNFVNQYYDYGLKMPIVLSSDFLLTPDFLQQLGDKALGIIGEGFYNYSIDTDFNKRFVEAWTKKYGVYPDPNEACAYASTACFIEALRATGGDSTPVKIVEAIRKERVETPQGYMSFNPEGVGITDKYITKVVKKEDKYVWAVLETYPQELGMAPSERQ